MNFTIYDASGRTVRHLMQQVVQPGVTSVIWDGRDEGGHAAASGVYLYRLETDARRVTGRIALMK